MDYAAIAAAIATRYDPSQVAIVPPAGEEQIRSSTHQLPEGLGGDLPRVLVWPPTVTNIRVGASTRLATLKFPVRFYYRELAFNSYDYGHLYGWMTALQDQIIGAVHIGLPTYVARAWLESAVPGSLGYGGSDYVGIEFTVSVETSEAISPVA